METLQCSFIKIIQHALHASRKYSMANYGFYASSTLLLKQVRQSQSTIITVRIPTKKRVSAKTHIHRPKIRSMREIKLKAQNSKEPKRKITSNPPEKRVSSLTVQNENTVKIMNSPQPQATHTRIKYTKRIVTLVHKTLQKKGAR